MIRQLSTGLLKSVHMTEAAFLITLGGIVGASYCCHSSVMLNGGLTVVCLLAIVSLPLLLNGKLRQVEGAQDVIGSLLNAVPESMILIDPEGVILAINETAARRLDSEPHLMVGRRLWEFIPPELAEMRRERLLEVLATKRQVTFEDRRGGYSFYHVNTPLLDHDMRVSRIAVLAFDITNIKKAEAALLESEETFRQLFEEAPDPILLIDSTNCFVDCNLAALRMLAADSKEQVLQQHPSYFSPEFQPDGQLSAQKANVIIRTVFERQNMHFEWLHRRLDGSEFYVEVSLNLIMLKGQKVQLVHWRDITERKQAEKTLRTLSTAMEHSPAAIVITDVTGAIEYVNPKFYEMTGYTAEEVSDQNCRILKSGTHAPGFYRDLWQTILAGKEWRGEFHNRSKEGRLFWENASISPIKDATGAIRHFVAVKEEITERKLMQEQLAYMAHFDSLTGLPNRALFFDRTRQAVSLAKREKRCCGFMFIDLDGFKGVNDTHGHEAGDQLLRLVAERIKGALRESDTVARMGGDEFAVILATLGMRNDAAHVAEKISSQLSQPFVIGQAVCSVGASIGISIYPDDADDVEALLHCADTAMYEVKRCGKNHYRFFEAPLGARSGLSDSESASD